jgi:hypothetical protein
MLSLDNKRFRTLSRLPLQISVRSTTRRTVRRSSRPNDRQRGKSNPTISSTRASAMSFQML